jgi:N-acetylmuramoyl-L-alanine amidase
MSAVRSSSEVSGSRAPPPNNPSHRDRRRAQILRRRGLVAEIAVAVATGIVLLQSSSSAAKRMPVRAAAGRTTATVAGGPGGRPVAMSRFAQGACVSFPPTAGDRHRTVFVDAGHGGIDPGAIGVTESGLTIHEANLTLPVDLDTAALLRRQGFTVVVSRTGASSVVRLQAGDLSAGALTIQGAHDDLAVRDICANVAKASILIGVYFDAGPTQQNAGSITAYDTARPFSAANLRLAGLDHLRDEVSSRRVRPW